MAPARDLTPYQAMFETKVLECQRKTKHPWEDCVCCHPRENARRRAVTKHRYAAEPCPDYAKDEYCELGDECPYAHGTFEVHLHPAKYCTKMCTKGATCSRRICFFAHSESELREPDYSYGPKNTSEALVIKQQLMAERAQKVLNEQHARQSEIEALQQLQSSAEQSRMASLPVMSPAFLGSPQPQASSYLSSGQPAFSVPLFPAPLDIAAINKECESVIFGDNMADCQSLASSPLTSISKLPRHSPTKSPQSSCNAPRMSVRKARELGIEPKKQPRATPSPGSCRSSSLPQFNASPVRQAGPMQAMSPNSQARVTTSTRLVSPDGLRLTIDQAIRMLQFMDGSTTGSLASYAEVDFLTAMTRLKMLGWTTCLVEEVEDSQTSGNSSPDRFSFSSCQFSKPFGQRMSIDGSLLPSMQTANLLAGSGLDFAPERFQAYSSPHPIFKPN